jgi:hypothetical protein
MPGEWRSGSHIVCLTPFDRAPGFVSDFAETSGTTRQDRQSQHAGGAVSRGNGGNVSCLTLSRRATKRDARASGGRFDIGCAQDGSWWFTTELMTHRLQPCAPRAHGAGFRKPKPPATACPADLDRLQRRGLAKETPRCLGTGWRH